MRLKSGNGGIKRKSMKTNKYKVGDRVYYYVLKGIRNDFTVKAVDGDFVVSDNKSRIHFKAIAGRLIKKPKLGNLKPGDPAGGSYIYVGLAYDDEQKRWYHLSVSLNTEEKSIDWHTAMSKYKNQLPTKKEAALIIAALPQKELDLLTGWCWSSTEYLNTTAYYQRFSGGSQSLLYKNGTNEVRCVARKYLP